MRARLENLLGDGFVRRFAGIAGMSLALRVAWAVLNYAGVFLLARWLAPDSYGVFAIVMSIILPLSIICGVGLPTSIMRFLGQYEAESRPSMAKGLIAEARKVVLGCALAATALLIAGVWTLKGLGRGIDPVSYSLGFLILPIYTYMSLQSSIARANGAVFTALAPRDVLWRGLLIPIGYLSSTYAAAGTQLLALFLFGAGALFLLAAVQARQVTATIPEAQKNANANYDRPLWRGVSGPIWLSGSAVTLGANLDVIAVGSILSEAEAGLYFLVQRTATLASFVLVSINLVMGPEVSKLYFARKTDKLNRLLRFTNLLVLLPSVGALIFFAFAGRWLLGLAGPEAASLYPELLILCVGQCINAATGCVGVVLNMTGSEKVAAWIRTIFAVLGGIAMFAGTLWFGTMGAAVAAAATLAGSNLAMAVYARMAIGIDASAYALFSLPRGRD